jgi:hypothetical protein
MSSQKRKFIYVCVLFFLATAISSAQNFKAFRSLRIIKTEHFDIIFPEESASTANTLAGFAEETYHELSRLLGINLYKRIPVVITPDTDQFNGYMMSVPSPHIVMFDTPMDIESFNYEHNLRGLFLHELTHAFSLSSRPPALETMSRIFGSWASPTLFTTPLFMVEGVTVSFESLTGFGRANDPLVKQELRQAIHEKNVLTPFQFSGVYDLAPRQASYYEYGGLFSAYLQQRYGMEKYAELWKLLGAEYDFSFTIYNSGFYQSFKNVYEISFVEVWNNFLENISLDNIRENPQSINFSSQKRFINALTSSSSEIFFANHYDRELLRYNPQTQEIKKVMNMDSAVHDIAISPDEKNILLSSYRYKGALAAAVVSEYNLSSGLSTGRKWEHIARGQYFRDGIIGLASNLHNTNIVFRNAAGIEEVLLRGNEELMYTTPYAVNQNWIIYVRALKGFRELCMYNYETKKEYVLQSNLEDDILRWKYIRNLRVSNGKVMFAYNHDDRMYKLGVIDLSQFTEEDSVMNAVFSSIDFSGGVFFPSHIDGEIFYRGFFSSEDKLMQFPEKIDALSGVKTEIILIPNDENLEENFSSAIANQTIENISFGKNYFDLSYLNPFRYWIPLLPLIRPTESFISFDGWGLQSVMIDPTDTNVIYLTAIGDWKAKMANLAITWDTLYFGFPLTLAFADGVDLMYGDNSFRQTAASLTGTFLRSIANERNTVSLIGGINFSIHADNPFDNSSAYTWDYEEPEFSFTLGTSWSNIYRYAWQLFGTGANLSAYYRTPFDFSETRIDGNISFAIEKMFPLRFQFYGAWDTKGMDMQGNNQTYNSYFANAASVEYLSPNGLNVEWLAGGQAEIKLFGFEIQKNLSHIYFNRMYSTLAYRGVLYDGQSILDAEGNSVYENLLLAQSLVLRLGLEFTILPLKSTPFKMMPNVWGAWKISNMNDGKPNDFYFNFGFEMSI